MKAFLSIFIFLALACQGQETKKEFVGKEQPGALLEHFTLRNGQTLDGIWDEGKMQIHIVKMTNHIANFSVSSSEILLRKAIGDGSNVKLYSDVDLAEKNVDSTLANFKAAHKRLVTATQNRDKLHQFYHGKTLPSAQYQAVMVRYKAADTEVAAAQNAQANAETGFTKALESYQKAGGKTAYSLR